MNAERAKEIARYILNTLHPNMSLDQIYIVVQNFTGSPDNVGTRLVENMKTVLYLEQQRPGICQVLRKEFGIRNFFRYPAEILINQYDTRDIATKKGIAAVALYDHNGAFYQRTSQRAIAVSKQGEILDIQADWSSGKATYYNNAQI